MKKLDNKIPEEIENLILDQLNNELSQYEESILIDWISKNSTNRLLYQQFVEKYSTLSFAVNTKSQKVEQAWQHVYKRIVYKQLRYRIKQFSQIAALLVILIGCYILYPAKESNNTLEQLPTEPVLILSNGQKIILSNVSKIKDGAVNNSDNKEISYTESMVNDTMTPTYNTLQIPDYGEYVLVLHDSSRIFLNAGSEIRYPVPFCDSIREIWIKGEAFCQIHENKQWPFKVHLDRSTIHVTGTSFNVQAYEQDQLITVTLESGSIRFENAQQTVPLSPGQQVRYNQHQGSLETKEVNAARYSAWRHGILYFEEMPLETLLQNLSRWYKINYQFIDPKLKLTACTGGIRRYDSIAHIIEMLNEILEINITQENNIIYINSK